MAGQKKAAKSNAQKRRSMVASKSRTSAASGSEISKESHENLSQSLDVEASHEAVRAKTQSNGRMSDTMESVNTASASQQASQEPIIYQSRARKSATEQDIKPQTIPEKPEPAQLAPEKKIENKAQQPAPAAEKKVVEKKAEQPAPAPEPVKASIPQPAAKKTEAAAVKEEPKASVDPAPKATSTEVARTGAPAGTAAAASKTASCSCTIQ